MRESRANYQTKKSVNSNSDDDLSRSGSEARRNRALHLRGMFLHGAEQLKLGTGTLKVVTGPFYFEVGIAQ